MLAPCVFIITILSQKVWTPRIHMEPGKDALLYRNACHARLFRSHNPELPRPSSCCWGFTSLFVSPRLLWSPIRTASPLIGLLDVRRRFTLVMYWSGPEGCVCVCVQRSQCLYELIFLFSLSVCAGAGARMGGVCGRVCVSVFFYCVPANPFGPCTRPRL